MRSMPRARRAVRGGLMACAAALVLPACQVGSTVTLDVRDDGTGSVTVLATASPEVVAAEPGLADALLLDDARAAGWEVLGPEPTVDGGLSLTLRQDFDTPEQATSLLAQLGGPAGPYTDLRLARTGSETDATYTLDGTLHLDGGLAALADAEAIETLGAVPLALPLERAGVDPAGALRMELVATLPGTVERTSGERAGATLRWVVPTDGSAVDLVTRSRSSALGTVVARWASRGTWLLAAAWLVGGAALIARRAVSARSRRTPAP